MAEHTYDDLHKLLGITTDDLEPRDTEKFINLAIGYLNIFGAGLPVMAGTEGSMSINCEPNEWAAIMHVTRMVYTDFYEDAGGDLEIQDLTAEARNFLSDPDVMEAIRIIAIELRARDSSVYDDIILV